MLRYDIRLLDSLGNELVYIDENTGKPVTRVPVFVERMHPTLAFVYLASPYAEENVNFIPNTNVKYKDIAVFDNVGPKIHGWNRNYIEANYKEE